MGDAVVLPPPLCGVTIPQPYASLAAGGVVDHVDLGHEPGRGFVWLGRWVALHAGARLATGAASTYEALQREKLDPRNLRRAGLSCDARQLPLGAVIGVARLVGVERAPRVGLLEPQGWRWRLADAWALPRAVDVVGTHGVWLVPDAAVRSIREQWRHARRHETPAAVGVSP